VHSVFPLHLEPYAFVGYRFGARLSQPEQEACSAIALLLRLYQWRAYLRDPPRTTQHQLGAGLGWLAEKGHAAGSPEEAAELAHWVLAPVCPRRNKRFAAAFAHAGAAEPIFAASRACTAAAETSERWDPLDLVWSKWCKTLQDFFRRHRSELKQRREAWDKVVRKASASIRAEQERDRRTGLLFRLAKPCSEAVSDESVWLEVEGDDGVCRWTLS
jgi:hypothetical protein